MRIAFRFNYRFAVLIMLISLSRLCGGLVFGQSVQADSLQTCTYEGLTYKAFIKKFGEPPYESEWRTVYYTKDSIYLRLLICTEGAPDNVQELRYKAPWKK